MKKENSFDIDVLHEEIIIHPTATQGLYKRLMYGEARIIGTVEIDGKIYEFNTVIDIQFEPVENKS